MLGTVRQGRQDACGTFFHPPSFFELWRDKMVGKNPVGKFQGLEAIRVNLRLFAVQFPNLEKRGVSDE